MATSYDSPCDSYPRIVENVLSDADVAHFKQLYKELAEDEWLKRESQAKANGCAAPPRRLEYFTLLKHIHGKPQDEKLAKILDKIYERVEAVFGPGYVAVQDFWSWRAPDSVAAERIHMDGDFWLTGANDGFNLWLLLDHCDMAHSFDIFTKEDNPDLYKLVGRRVCSIIRFKEARNAGPGLLFWEPLRLWPVLFELSSKAARELGMILSVFSTWYLQKTMSLAVRAQRTLPGSVFRGLISVAGWLGNFSLMPTSMVLKTRKFPLAPGDALVVRQDELHVSDQDPLKEGQFRLAVGLKFMRQHMPVRQYVFTGPASKNRRRYPALRLPWGRPLPDIYRQQNVDMGPYQESSWLQRLFARSFHLQVA